MNYPARDPFFAHKFVRLLHKAAVASEIGRDAFAILVVVAHTEDAMRYRGPAKFWNSQLVETLGFSKWDQFDKARKKAIDAGWLSYQCHGKRQAGEYFVQIPDGYEVVSDAPVEESYPKSGYDAGYKDGYEAGVIEGMNRGQSGVRSGDDVGDKQGEPSIPRPDPIPNPEPERGKTAVAAPPTDWQEQILEAFDETFGTSSRLTAARAKHLNARWRDPWWQENWQMALERGGESAFLRGANDRGWVIDFEFFLRPDTATKILEGKYDDRQKHDVKKNGHKAAEREAANADAFAVLYATIGDQESQEAG